MAAAAAAAGVTGAASDRGGALTSVWTQAGRYFMHARVSTTRPVHPAPQVVLVHGLGASSRYMVPLAVRLARWFPVSIPDQPGFGRSEKPRVALDLRALADAVSGWIDARGLGRVVLVGNSLGCQVAVEIALRHPRVVDRLVLQGATPDPKARTVPRQMMQWNLNSMREGSLGLAGVLDYYDAGIRRVGTTFGYMRRDPIEQKLTRVAAPALVVRGSRDPLMPQWWAEEIVRLLPRARLVVIPGAAHTMNYHWPLEFARVVRGFLSEPPSAGRILTGCGTASAAQSASAGGR